MIIKQRGKKIRVNSRRKDVLGCPRHNVIRVPENKADVGERSIRRKPVSVTKIGRQTSRREIVNEGGVVLYENTRYRWSKGFWYYLDSNTEGPSNLSILLETKYLPLERIPKSKSRSTDSEDVARRSFFMQGGLPGLGKKR